MINEEKAYTKKTTLFNTAMLYILTIAKIVFPLITLPYLTRILSKDCYGVVSYVKSYIVYAQLIVDFGFILSSVKDIVKCNGDKDKIGIVAGQTFLAKILLAFVAFIITIVCCFTIPILKEYFLFTILSYLVVFLSCFLADFLFRGIEKMHYISIVFVVMKTISTALTFVFVKNDGDILWIPILDIISSFVAIAVTLFLVAVKIRLKIRIVSFITSIIMIKDSFFYFISNMATTAFGALNTLLIGIFILDKAEIAYWSLCSTVVAAIQSLYTPITNGVYPYMIKHKNLGYIHKVLLVTMPILTIGAVVGFFTSKVILNILGGEKYVEAYVLLRCLIPLIYISFPSMLYGWPTLGAIGKVKQTSITTIVASIAQIIGLFLLILSNHFTLIAIAWLRFAVELLLFGQRFFLTYKYKGLFLKNNTITEVR